MPCSSASPRFLTHSLSFEGFEWGQANPVSDGLHRHHGARGCAAPSDTARVVYTCTDVYRADDDRWVTWCDTTLAVAWPVIDPLVSEKDAWYLPPDASRSAAAVRAMTVPREFAPRTVLATGGAGFIGSSLEA